MVPLLKRAVKVEADSIAGDARVFVSKGEDERGVITETDPTLTHAQAALRLAEEDDIRWQREVGVVLQWIAPQQLWCLCHAVTTGLSE